MKKHFFGDGYDLIKPSDLDMEYIHSLVTIPHYSSINVLGEDFLRKYSTIKSENNGDKK